MPLNVAQLVAKRVPLTFTYDGQEVHLEFRPLSEVVQTKLRETITEPPDETALRHFLAAVLVSWDVLSDDGTPYPTTAEALIPFPYDFLMAATMAVQEAIRPNLDSAGTSGATSLPAVRSA